MPAPLRFRNQRQREDHFLNHRVELDPIPETEDEYEDRASAFAVRPLTNTMRQDIRPFDGATIRWDRTTDEFVIVTKDGFLATYMVLDTKWHGFTSNRGYYEWQLKRKR